MALPRARAWTIYRAGILLANMPPGAPKRPCKLNSVPPERSHPGYYGDSENMKQIKEGKMVGYKLSKNDLVAPFFVIFRSVREKLLVTVFFYHPVTP